MHTIIIGNQLRTYDSSNFFSDSWPEIVNDLLVENNFESDNVQYVLGGIILAFLGLLVHDSIRERVDEKLLPVEE